ncbi:MAG: hypothetical protein QNJ09_04315 [Paracoccaceae bacterium]|nr:hypothetical protein [Paracoccaceae bacterium]
MHTIRGSYLYDVSANGTVYVALLREGYASDRYKSLHLFDYLKPIEAGVLADGSPNLCFQKLSCWSSGFWAKTLDITRFDLRAIYQNRKLWGVEDFQEFNI